MVAVIVVHTISRVRAVGRDDQLRAGGVVAAAVDERPQALACERELGGEHSGALTHRESEDGREGGREGMQGRDGELTERGTEGGGGGERK